jgi:hypothetical protein
MMFPDIGATEVIYTTTSDDFKAGYAKLLDRHKDKPIRFCVQTDFKQNVVRTLEGFQRAGYTYVLGNCDDNLFINEWPKGTDVALDEPEVAISIRLHRAAIYCIPARSAMIPPDDEQRVGGYYVWDWTKCAPGTDWGYPHAVDFHIYRISDFLGLARSGQYAHPSALEVWMNTNRDYSRPMMKRLEKPCLIGVCNNIVSEGSTNPSGNETTGSINEKWLGGFQINIEPFLGLETDACHIIKPYEFEVAS